MHLLKFRSVYLAIPVDLFGLISYYYYVRVFELDASIICTTIWIGGKIAIGKSPAAAYVEHNSGGAYQTLRYAKKQEKAYINIGDNSMEASE